MHKVSALGKVKEDDKFKVGLGHVEKLYLKVEDVLQ